MLKAIFCKIIPSGLSWLYILTMIYCLNGMGTGIDSGVAGSWLCILLILSFMALVIATNSWGNVHIYSAPAFYLGHSEVHVQGNSVFVTKGGIVGLFKLIVNFFKCLLVDPFVGVFRFLGCLFRLDIVGESEGNAFLGYVAYIAAVLLLLVPLNTHIDRTKKYDCTQFRYELLDVYYTKEDGTNWTHVDLKIEHPSKEISSVSGNLYFCIDEEVAASTSYNFRHNTSTPGLLSMQGGDKEDLPEVVLTISFRQGKKLDLVGMFAQGSDRLTIVHELTSASFMRDLITAEMEYFEKLPDVTIYSGA